MIGNSPEVSNFNRLNLKLRNVNSHNVAHTLISRNPRERMFVVQISLFIVTFLSLISQNLSLMQTTKEVNPHLCIAPCVNMWSATFFFFFFFFCHILNVGACIYHIVQEGQVDWTTPHHTTPLKCCLWIFYSVTCYTNSYNSTHPY